MTGDIWLGDLVRAYRRLGATTASERAAIARSLGLSRLPAGAAPTLSPSPEIAREPVAPTEPVPRPQPVPRPSRPPEDATEPAPAPTGDRSGALPVVGYDTVFPSVPMGDVLDRGAGRPDPEPPHVALMNPRSSRAVLQALLAQGHNTGPVDVPALVRAAAARRITHLPRQVVPTLCFGVQVLADCGRGMAPFTADQDHLVEQVRELVGADRTEVRYFADTPRRGSGPGPVWTWRDGYRPPPSGTPVLLLSDLGISHRWEVPGRERTEWEAVASVVRGNGSEIVALVPYPPARWPQWSRRLFTILMWDRALTAGRARAARR